MAPDELSTCSRAPDTFSRKITAPSAPRTLSLRDAFLISATASLMRLIGKSERHTNALARESLSKGPTVRLGRRHCLMVLRTDQFKGPSGCQLIRLFAS